MYLSVPKSRISVASTNVESSRHTSVMSVVLVSFIYFMDQCNSEGVLGVLHNKSTSAVIMADNISMQVKLSHISNVDRGIYDTDKSHPNIAHDKIMSSITMSKETLRQNHPSEYDHVTSYPGTVRATLSTATSMTSKRQWSYSPRPIYIRGHLLHHPSRGKQMLQPAQWTRGVIRAPNSNPLGNINGIRYEPEDVIKRKKRKQLVLRDRSHRYDQVSDAIQGADDSQQTTGFYAWIFGASILGLGSLVSVTSCFVFCFHSDKVKLKLKTQLRHGDDTARDYERVESVSAIVDDVEDYSEQYDDQEYSEMYDDPENPELCVDSGNPDIYETEYSKVSEDRIEDVIEI